MIDQLRQRSNRLTDVTDRRWLFSVRNFIRPAIEVEVSVLDILHLLDDVSIEGVIEGAKIGALAERFPSSTIDLRVLNG